MRRLPAAVGLLALAAALCARPSPAAAADFESLVATFTKDMKDAKPETRLRALRMAAESRDLRAATLLVAGVESELGRRDDVAKRQAEQNAALAKILDTIQKENAKQPQSQREIEAYNRRMQRLEKDRDALNATLRNLAGESQQAASVVGAGVAQLGALLGSLRVDHASTGFDEVAAAWLGPKSPVEARLRFVAVAASTKGPEGARRLALVARDAAEGAQVRGAALVASATRREDGTTADATSWLPSKDRTLAGSAVEALRLVHAKEGIEPLIEFLARPDEEIGVLREKARTALVSLTGQTHGPFAAPWRDWWGPAKGSFAMPPAPVEVRSGAEGEAKAGFYGITTVSDRILFVLDISKSMLELAHPEAGSARADARRIDVAKKELLGFLGSLDDKAAFNLVFFHHKLVPYEAAPVVATATARARAKDFVTALEPTGGTNIYDALETGFRMANAASADGKDYKSVYDTIFFMTDGTPTAGKVQDPDRILAAVAEWNRTARITVHVIGVGDTCDEKFLRALAAANGGEFRLR